MQRQHADDLTAADEGYAEHAAITEVFRILPIGLGLAIDRGVADVHDTLRLHDPLHDEGARDGPPLPDLLAKGGHLRPWIGRDRREVKPVAGDEEEVAAHPRATQAGRPLNDGIEHRLEVGRRPAHDTEDLGEGGLARERLHELTLDLRGRRHARRRGRHGPPAFRTRTWPEQSAQPLHPPDSRPC